MKRTFNDTLPDPYTSPEQPEQPERPEHCPPSTPEKKIKNYYNTPNFNPPPIKRKQSYAKLIYSDEVLDDFPIIIEDSPHILSLNMTYRHNLMTQRMIHEIPVLNLNS